MNIQELKPSKNLVKMVTDVGNMICNAKGYTEHLDTSEVELTLWALYIINAGMEASNEFRQGANLRHNNIG